MRKSLLLTALFMLVALFGVKAQAWQYELTVTDTAGGKALGYGAVAEAHAAFSVSPDYGISVDVTDVGDVPGCDPMEVKLGKGAAIKIKDKAAKLFALVFV